MRKIAVQFFLLLTLGFLGSVPIAESSRAVEEAKFILTYRKNNLWINKADAAPLRRLVKTAKDSGKRHFQAILPKNKRKIAVERLVVLRNIMDTQLDSGLVIEEIDGSANANTLVIKIAN